LQANPYSLDSRSSRRARWISREFFSRRIISSPRIRKLLPKNDRFSPRDCIGRLTCSPGTAARRLRRQMASGSPSPDDKLPRVRSRRRHDSAHNPWVDSDAMQRRIPLVVVGLIALIVIVGIILIIRGVAN
jgi:hypothetical protein